MNICLRIIAFIQILEVLSNPMLLIQFQEIVFPPQLSQP